MLIWKISFRAWNLRVRISELQGRNPAADKLKRSDMGTSKAEILRRLGPGSADDVLVAHLLK